MSAPIDESYRGKYIRYIHIYILNSSGSSETIGTIQRTLALSCGLQWPFLRLHRCPRKAGLSTICWSSSCHWSGLEHQVMHCPSTNDRTQPDPRSNLSFVPLLDKIGQDPKYQCSFAHSLRELKCSHTNQGPSHVRH